MKFSCFIIFALVFIPSICSTEIERHRQKGQQQLDTEHETNHMTEVSNKLKTKFAFSTMVAVSAGVGAFNCVLTFANLLIEKWFKAKIVQTIKDFVQEWKINVKTFASYTQIFRDGVLNFFNAMEPISTAVKGHPKTTKFSAFVA